MLKSTSAAPGFGSSNRPGCDPSNLTLVPTSGLNINVPVGTNDVYAPGTFRLAADSPNECQGAVIVRSATVRFSTP